MGSNLDKTNLSQALSSQIIGQQNRAFQGFPTFPGVNGYQSRELKAMTNPDGFISAGELARLAGTTKRTIHFYHAKRVLKPAWIDRRGYRYYRQSQVLEYQMILLLTTLGASLDDIRNHQTKAGNLANLFNERKSLIKAQIENLDFNLRSVESFHTNLELNGTMIEPQVKKLRPFSLYYIDRTGPYAKIADYCEELCSMFSCKGSPLTTMAIFYDPNYQPKKCRMKIGVLAKPGIKPKTKYKNNVKYMTFKPGKVITYSHNGAAGLLSLFWKELEKYCALRGLKVRYTVPDFEIYRTVDARPAKQFFEIYLPIE